MNETDYYNARVKAAKDAYCSKEDAQAQDCNKSQPCSPQPTQIHRGLITRRNDLRARIDAYQSKLDIVDSLIDALIS